MSKTSKKDKPKKSGKVDDSSATGKVAVSPEPGEHEAYEALRSTVKKDAPFGISPLELAEWDSVDTELMKRGTLAHAQIDWAVVKEASLSILGSTSKYPEVLDALIISLLSSGIVDDFVASIVATDEFLTTYPIEEHPCGQRRYGMIMKRVVSALANSELVATPKSPDDWKIATSAAQSLYDTSQKDPKSNFGKEAKSLISALENHQNSKLPSDASIASTDPKASKSTDEGAAAGKSPTPTPTTAVASEKIDERVFRRDMSTLADTLYSIDPANPLGYQIRRYATWFGISSAPQIRDGNKSVVAPPVTDLTEICQQIIADNSVPDDALMLRLERMTFNTPFWLEGQYIASQLATLAGRKEISNSIRKQVHNFVGSQKWISKLQFSDGSPFVSDPVTDWLGGLETTRDQHADAGSIADRDTALADSAVAADKDAISKIEDRLAASARGRDLYYLEAALVHAMARQGFSKFAKQSAVRIEKEVGEMTVKEWEPAFFNHLNGDGSP